MRRSLPCVWFALFVVGCSLQSDRSNSPAPQAAPAPHALRPPEQHVPSAPLEPAADPPAAVDEFAGADRDLRCRELATTAANAPGDPELRSAKRRKSQRPDGAEHPDLAARWRYEQRLNEDGTLTPNGLILAKHDIDIMVARELIRGQRMRAGISPPTWTWLGPGNIGGRIRAILVHPTSPNRMYVGSVSGGIWRTDDAGGSWEPLQDFMANLAVNSMVMDPTNANVIYAGTGEGFNNIDALPGAGVFKTTDGGDTWTQLAATAAGWQFTNRLAIHPTNGQILLAATDHGVEMTTNGGATWTPASTGAFNTLDIDFDPADGNNAVSGTRSRMTQFSTNGGQSWQSVPLYRDGRERVAMVSSNAVAGVDHLDLNMTGAGLGFAGTTGLLQVGLANNLEIVEIKHIHAMKFIVSGLTQAHAVGEPVISLWGNSSLRSASVADGNPNPDTLKLRHLTGIVVNDQVRIGIGASAEVRTVMAVNAGSNAVTVADLNTNHVVGVPVVVEFARTTLSANTGTDGDSNPDTIPVNSRFGFGSQFVAPTPANPNPRSCQDRITIGTTGVAAEITPSIPAAAAGQLITLDLQQPHNMGDPVLLAGRVEVAYSRSHPNIVYAVVEQIVAPGAGSCRATYGIWLSVDGGRSYVPRNISTDWLVTQGFYDNALWVDPLNPNIVIVGGIDLWRSANGGASFTRISNWALNPGGDSVHADHHIIVEHPAYRTDANTDGVPDVVTTVFFGNDGGIYRAANARTVACTALPCANDWQELNNQLGITQFYGGAVSSNGVVLGGTQDNGTQRRNNAETAETWHLTQQGDGGKSAADLADDDIFYGETHSAFVFRSTNAGQSATFIDAPPMGSGACNFIAPLELDPNNRDRLLSGCRDLFLATNARTSGGAANWASIKAPLAPATAGGRISAIAVRGPLATGAGGNSNIIWVGHNDGRLFRTVNGGAAWPAVANAPGTTPARFVTDIEFDPHSANKVYVTFSGYAANNVWSTSDNGTNWANKIGDGTGGVLPNIPINTIAIHPDRAGWLYVGTDLGVFATTDDGKTWSTANAGATAINDGPANVEVDELFFANDRRTLYAATHGRGMYQTDVGTTGLDDQDIGTNCIARVSRRFDGPAPDAAANQPSVSGDGRFVAFTTAAADLLPGGVDSNGRADVYVRDRQTGTHERVSLTSLEEQLDRAAQSPDISADGRFVAFVSDATNLPGVPNKEQIHLRDRVTGTTTLASRTDSGDPGNGASSSPTISGDGRYVAFLSRSTNLDFAGTADRDQVYLHDRISGETKLVSFAVGFVFAAADRSCHTPHISKDGRYVAYASASTNLTTVPANGKSQIFIYDRVTDVNTQFVVGPALTDVPNQHCLLPTLSADGRYVALASAATNLVDENSNTNGKQHIYVYDRDANTNGTFDETAASSNGIAVHWVTKSCGGGETNADSDDPKISDSGQYVVFTSQAGNLLPVPINTSGAPVPFSIVRHVFAHNRDTDFNGKFDEAGAVTNVRLSVNIAAEEADNHGAAPDVTSEGGFVVWQTEATNLDPTGADANGFTDVYLRDRFPLSPCVLLEPIDALVCPGESVKFVYHADYVGNPDLLEWHQDGFGPIDFGQVYSIASAEAADAGSYEVLVFDLDGVTLIGTSDPAELTVLGDELVITGQPDDVTICLTFDATFTVTATGSDPGLQYRWRKDGQDIPGPEAATPTYTINSALPSDAGTYTVRITDRCEREVISEEAELDYLFPYIVTEPVDVNVCTGGIAVFHVVAAGAGPLTYKWKRDGIFIDDAPPKIIGTKTATLMITDVTFADVAAYNVEITNACGTILTSPVELFVDTDAPLITLQPEGDSVCVGDAVSFTVQATNAGSYQWFHDDQPVVSTNGTLPTLSIGFVTLADAGTYGVVVQNGCGQDVSSNAILEVQDCEPICGDLDHDLDVDADDFDIFVAAFASSNGSAGFVAEADYDTDNLITFVDYQVWLGCYRDFVGVPGAPPPLGVAADFNGDEDVDLRDFGAYQCCAQYGVDEAFACLIRFDLNRDGALDDADYSAFIGALGGPGAGAP